MSKRFVLEIIFFNLLTYLYSVYLLELLEIFIMNTGKLFLETINIDPETMGGTPVFVGTRVPIQSLFDFLSTGETLEEFLDNFPSVKRDAALRLIEIAGIILSEQLKSMPPSKNHISLSDFFGKIPEIEDGLTFQRRARGRLEE